MPSFNELFPTRNLHMRLLFGAYLLRKRTELGFTKTAVALNCLMTVKKYSQLEAGATAFSEEQFNKLVETLDLEADDLIELSQISKVRVINEVAEALCENFPS